MGTILLTGGAGYVGSHLIPGLLKRGHPVVVFDRVEPGHADPIQRPGVELVMGDPGDSEALRPLLAAHRFSAILHLCCPADPLVPVADGCDQAHTSATLHLARQAIAVGHGVSPPIVFSCARSLFGMAERAPQDRPRRCAPTPSHAASLAALERIQDELGQAHGLRSVVVRCSVASTVASSHPVEGWLQSQPRLMPLVELAAREQRQRQGCDAGSPAPSSRSLIDWLADLLDVHLLALDHLLAGGEACAFQLADEAGRVVLEVSPAALPATGRDSPLPCGSGRSGDPLALLGDSAAGRRHRSWRRRRSVRDPADLSPEAYEKLSQ